MKHAVIGAGPAGLLFARMLFRAGQDVMVLEKSRGPGGRAATRRRSLERAGRMIEIAFDHGLPFVPRDALDLLWAADPSLKIPDLQAWWVADRPHGPAQHIPAGLGMPRMSALGRLLSRGLDVRTGHTVDCLNPLPSGQWHVLTVEGQNLGPFDFVTLAVPAPQATALLPDGALKEHTGAIGYSPCWTLMLAGPTRLPDEPVILSGGADAATRWILMAEHAKPGRDQTGGGARYTLQADSLWSSAHLEEAPDTMIAPLRAYGAARLSDHPRLATWFGDGDIDLAMAHRWRFSRCTAPSSERHLIDHAQRLAVIGDGFQGPKPLDEGGATGLAQSILSALSLVDELVPSHRPLIDLATESPG